MRSLNPTGDTIFHQINNFSFINQDSQVVERSTFEDKIYVSDFFFTTCPSICPVMTSQMKRVYAAYEKDPEVLLLSHSIDFRNDSVPVLKAYALEKGITNAEKWHFVTGKREDIYDIAKNSYYISAMEDEGAPGGYLHNGKFILVDKQGRIRGYYTGTEAESVDQLIQDIKRLKEEG